MTTANVLSVTIFLLCFVSTASVASTLRLVNLVYRHGDRAPVLTYPNNPHVVNQTWPQGLGWLTKIGMQQHYSLGRYLRRRYDGFISKNFVSTEITVHSSYIERCLMSAYSNLAGLFPPEGDQVWNPSIDWQPIPVRTRPLDEDCMLSMDETCPKYEQLYNASLKSERVKREETENKEFYKLISEKAGIPNMTIKNIWQIADILFVEKSHNLTWPKWVNSTLYDKLQDRWAWGFDLLYHGHQESRLKGGPLIKEWIHLTKKKMSDPSSAVKMNIYSAHDTTVVAVTSALKVFNMLPPPYTSTVIMELHEDPVGNFYVEMYFRNRSSTDPTDNTTPYQLTLPGCNFKCPFSQFISLTSDAVPSDWDDECSIHQTHKTQQTHKYSTEFIVATSVLSVVVCLLLVVVVVMALSLRRASRSKDFSAPM